MSADYRYATGTEQTYACLTCGAIVEESGRGLHDAFHDEVARVSAPGDHVLWLREPGGQP